jgi:hypothetical protein
MPKSNIPEDTILHNHRLENLKSYKKNAVFWDMETQFVCHRKHITSKLESSLLMLCKIWGFYSGAYEEGRLMGCDAVWLLWEPTFRRYVLPPSWGWKESAS